jgi:hypothetical protein
LGTVLLCAINGATVKNIFCEDGGANTFRVFNPTQGKKNIIDPLQSADQYASYYIII